MKKLPSPLAFSQKVVYFVMRHIMGTITSVDARDNVAALTFDDGPDPAFTPRLLDILDKHQVSATFFVVGETAQKYPELIRRIAQTGHVIGNHSWDHPAFPLITGRERRAQMRACAKAIAPYGQRIFRPPYLGNKIRPGSIVLFHDSLHDIIEERYINREPTLKAVDMLLEQLGDRFRFVTIPELLQHGRPRRVNWSYQLDRDFLNGLRKQDGQPSWRYPLQA